MRTKSLKNSRKPTKLKGPRKSARRTTVKTLRGLIERQQELAKNLLDLMEDIEDYEDGRILEEAIKQNKGRPLIPWEEAKKRLGLKFD